MRTRDERSTHLRCTDALAFEVAAALDAYDALVLSRPASEVHPAKLARAGAELNRLCRACAHLPQLSVACVALLLSHFALLADSSATLRAAGAAAAGTERWRAHQRCIDALKRQCRELLVCARLH